MSTQQQTIANSGPLAIKVTGGTSGTPATLTANQAGSFTFSDSSPLHIELLSTADPDLAGGPGED